MEPHELQSTRLLCPWNFPGKNTGVGCHFLLQGIFQTQGLNPHLLHWQADSLPLSHMGSPSPTANTCGNIVVVNSVSPTGSFINKAGLNYSACRTSLS